MHRTPRTPRLWRVTSIGVLLCAVFVAGSISSRDAHADEPTDRVLQLLEDDATGGTVGLYLKEVGGSVLAAHNKTFVFEPASTLKALIHFHAMKQVEDGTIINGSAVTVNRQIPWFMGPANYNNSPPPGTSCPDLTLPASDTLAAGLTAMMQPSDNRWTQAMRDFFGDANINQTRVDLGMVDTGLNHSPMGCGGAAIANPNELTLVDAGRLYEGVATGFLTSPTREAAYGLMLTDGGLLDGMIDQEGAALGLDPSTLGEVKAAHRSAIKAGRYVLNSLEYRSNAGWVLLAARDANCAPENREYVFGAFIHGATAVVVGDIRTMSMELLREQVRASLESISGCATSVSVTPSLDSNRVGEQHEVAATVRDDFGDPVSGVTVNFGVTGGPSSVDGEPSAPSPANGVAVTDADGRATFSYTNIQASVDTITATVPVQPLATQQLEDSATNRWFPLEATINSVTVDEGDAGTTPATFEVSLLEPSVATVTTQYTTGDGTATQPADYTLTSGQVEFAPGETAQGIVVPVVGDKLDELDEQFAVELTNAPGAIDVEFVVDTGTGTIVDDDRNGMFSCRGSAVRFGSNEPVVSNAADVPCSDDDAALARFGLSAGLVRLNLNALEARTDQTPDDLESGDPAAGDSGTARSKIGAVTISALLLNVTLASIQSEATVSCVVGPDGLVPQLSASSNIGSLTVNGVAVAVGSAPQTVPLLIGALHLNQTIETDTAIVQRAAVLELAGTSIVLAEAKADFEGTAAHPDGNPCGQ